MGKKVKKDDKSAPEDTFDPLLIESHQAETVVLMLSSSEDEVQIKACEAIYKFASKCDENKELLLQLKTCDQLIRLLKSDEKIIRRNAMMVLAVMSQHSDVRNALKDDNSVILTLIGLLANTEYLTTNEFAAMALGNLCQEFTVISKLIDHNGIPCLVECLSSEDPDVQKNSIHCLDLVLRDFEARPYLKQCNAIPAMLELLKSDYPIIQETTLMAFAKASLDSVIRGVIRDLDCLNRFVEIIGRPEFNDLHVLALQVIATCLEDLECVKQMKDSGGLMRLIAFIGDAQPPEEENKEKPKKTSKSGSAKKKKKEDEEKPKETAASTTLPEVKVQACKAIMRASRIDDVRKIFHELDTEKLLVALLSHESESVKASAAQAIGVMSQGSVCQASVFNYGGIEHIVKLLKSDHKELKEAATFALANLTVGNIKNCHEISSKNGLEHLIGCLAFLQEGICSNTLVTICNMATDESLRAKLLQIGLVKALVAPLSSISTSVQSKAAMAVASFLQDSKSKADFRNNEGILPLTQLLMSNNADVRRSACWAITFVATDKESAEELSSFGAISILQQLNQSETRRNKFSEAALNRLYDSNLNLKYALVGYLDFTDRLGDIFYDCGQHKPGSDVAPLEKFGLEEINNKRPIILVNSSLPKPMTPVQAVAPDNDEKKSQEEKITGKKKGSKIKKDSRRSSSVNPENSDDPTNNSTKADLENTMPSYKAPLDSRLLSYVEDVEEMIGPLTTVLEQVSELAKYVSKCMGGPISPQELMSFPYELAISQLKVELRSNVIPIGCISSGIHVHRALLFKYLADKLFIPTNLRRGNYNRSWNEIWINENEGKSSRLNMQLYLVDLIHEPGRLILLDSPNGQAYRKL